jgi:hypothetical protein
MHPPESLPYDWLTDWLNEWLIRLNFRHSSQYYYKMIKGALQVDENKILQ